MTNENEPMLTTLQRYEINVMGVSWYSPETWLELCSHPEAKIEKTYDDYLRTTERIIADMTAQGIRVVKQPINVSLMIKWCHKHGYEIDSKGRTVFGNALQCANADGIDIMSMPIKDNTRTIN